MGAGTACFLLSHFPFAGKREGLPVGCISSDFFGYLRVSKDKALRVAIDTIGEFLLHNDMMVYLVIFDRNAYHISRKLFAKINSYMTTVT